jgi:hypothetical protein
VIFSEGRVAGAAVAKLAYAVGLKSTGVFPVVGSSPTSRTIFFLDFEASLRSYPDLKDPRVPVLGRDPFNRKGSGGRLRMQRLYLGHLTSHQLAQKALPDGRLE